LQIAGTNGNQLTCINQDLYLETNADDSRYTWYFKEHESGSYEVIDTGTKRITGEDPGYYYAEISHDYCAPYKEYFIVAAPVDIVLQPQPVICSEAPVQLQGFPAGGTWSGDGILSEDGVLDPNSLPNGIHTFRYTVVTEAGCRFNEDMIITIHKLVKPEITSSSHSLCFNDPVTLNVENELNEGTVKWFFSDNGEEVGSGEELVVNKVGHYEAEVAKHGCVIRTDPVVVEARRDSLFVPNIFIPNGDPWNEYFEITGEGLNEFDVQVFNRYGDLVYRSSDPAFRWNGANASSGIYYWSVQYSDCENRRKAFKGFVQLVKEN
jgi:gliding motility-associated-like protein